MPSDEEGIAAKLRAIRQKNAGKVMRLSRIAVRAIQEIKKIEEAMTAEAATVAQCAAAGRTFESIYRDFAKEDEACSDILVALEKDAAAGGV